MRRATCTRACNTTIPQAERLGSRLRVESSEGTGTKVGAAVCQEGCPVVLVGGADRHDLLVGRWVVLLLSMLAFDSVSAAHYPESRATR